MDIDDILCEIQEIFGASGWYENGIIYLDIDHEIEAEKIRQKLGIVTKILPAYEYEGTK